MRWLTRQRLLVERSSLGLSSALYTLTVAYMYTHIHLHRHIHKQNIFFKKKN